MFSKESHLKTITHKLSLLELVVKNSNSIRFFDLNTVAEDFFVGLLNTVYGYSLVNLNHEDGMNRAAIDLGDTTLQLAVQVTSQRDSRKIQETLDAFERHGLGSDFTCLKILIIGTRTGRYESLRVPTDMTFDPIKDVIDIKSLLRDISKLETVRLERLASFVEGEVSDASVVAMSQLPELELTQEERPDRTVAIQDAIDAINTAFQNGRQFIDLIRQSPTKVDNALEAERELERAASMIEELLPHPELCEDDKINLEVLLPYYQYESLSSRRTWHYEKRQCDQARGCNVRASEYLWCYIQKLVQAINLPGTTLDKSHLVKQLDVAKFMESNDKVFRLNIDARQAFDSEDYMTAIDCYRRSLVQLDDVLSKAKILENGSYYRVVLGNKYGLLGNIKVAMTGHKQNSLSLPGYVPATTALHILWLALQAYKEGIAAYQANPEWEQYVDFAERTKQRVIELVEMNKECIQEIWAEFHDEPEMLRILKRIDPKTIVRLESGN